MSAAPATLPAGFAVRLGAGVRVRGRGRTLLGGAPPRVTRLGGRAHGLLAGGGFVVDDPLSDALATRLLAAGLVDPVAGDLPAVPLDQVTVVVPVRDRAAGLDRALGALGGAVAVVVVDDGSTDPSATVRTAHRHGAGVVLLEVNQGPAAARNAGLARVHTPYVVFVDSDVVLTAGALGLLVRHLGDHRVALVAPRILGLGRGPGVIGAYEAQRSSLDRGPRSALVRPRSPVAWVPSAVLAARVSALGAGFDPTLRSGEDVDLVWRLARDGWLVRYDADVVAHHDHLTDVTAWARRKAVYGGSAAPLASRHGADVAPAVLTPLSGAVALGLLAQRRWSTALTAAVTGAVAVRLARRLDDRALAAEIVARGVLDATTQTADLLLRHWWPLTVVAGSLSGRVRRAAVAAVVLDAVLTSPATLPRPGFVAARRLDDLAYGAGVWGGAVRHRSVRCLLPSVPSWGSVRSGRRRVRGPVTP